MPPFTKKLFPQWRCMTVPIKIQVTTCFTNASFVGNPGWIPSGSQTWQWKIPYIYVYIYDFPIIDIHWVQGFPISTFDYWARNQIVHYSSRFPHYSWLYAATCSRWIAGKSWISRCYRSYLTWPCQIPRHKQAPFGDTVYLVSTIYLW